MNEPSRSGHVHIAGLDGLRGLAALAVFGFHVNAVRHHGGLFGHAYLAVDFFFLLSGFVIGLAYEPKFQAGLGFAAYARARLIRLYPMITAGAVIGLAAALITNLNVPIWLCFVAQLAFIPFAFSNIAMFPLNGVQWSLWFEFIANFIHAATYRALPNRILAPLVLLSGFWLVTTDIHFGSLDTGWRLVDYLAGFPRVAFSFSLGIFIYRMSRLERLPKVALPWWLVAALLATALLLPRWSPLPDSAFVVLFFPVLLILVLGARTSVRLAPFVSWAGAVSYPIYAVHLPLLYIASFLAPSAAPGLVRAMYWLGIIVAILSIATLLERFYDRPLRRWLTGKSIQRANVAAAALIDPRPPISD